MMEIALVVLLFYGMGAWQSRHLLARSSEAPAFHLLTLDGREVSLESLRGKAVLIHFWATWCGVCKMEQSSLNALAEELPSDTALVTIVADGEDREHVARYVREHGIRYPVLLADESVVERFRVKAFPTNYYLDEAGKIRQSSVGMSNRLMMWVRLIFVSAGG